MLSEQESEIRALQIYAAATLFFRFKTEGYIDLGDIPTAEDLDVCPRYELDIPPFVPECKYPVILDWGRAKSPVEQKAVMSTRSNKRRISRLMQSRFAAYFWRSAEDLAWLNAAPVGREFGSTDYERLEQLDGFAFDTFGDMDLVNEWVSKPHPLLGGLTPNACARSDAGLEQALNLLAVIKQRKLLPDSQFVRDAIARMHTMTPHFLTDEMWDLMEDYDGPIVSGDPEGWVPDDLENDDNEEEGYAAEGATVEVVVLDTSASDALPVQELTGQEGYEPDDGPLTDKQIAALRNDVKQHFPTGQVLWREDLIQLTPTKPDLSQASAFVRAAMARMEASPHYFLSQEALDIMADYDGPIVSGDPDGGVPKKKKNGRKKRGSP